MAKNISLLGADYPDVPAVQLPQTGGGKATFYDINVIDNLNSDSSTDALSAKQGKVLNSKSLNKTTKTGTTSASGNINISMGVEQYDIISASYVGGIAIPYKANAYEWLVHVTDTSLSPIASTSVSLEIMYTKKIS